MELKGLATGIGSLPFREAGPALDLIFRYCPEIPFWPQLPRRGASESMVAQFSEGLPCLRLTADGLAFDPTNRDPDLEKFYDRVIAQDTDYFRISQGYAPGFHAFIHRLGNGGAEGAAFLKCHVTGPLTFAASVNDEKGIPIAHDEIMMQAVVKGLIMKALWQVAALRKFGKKIIVFIDEPFISSVGSGFTAFNKEDVTPVLEEFTQALAAEDVLVGVHCCGGADWTLFTGIPGLSIINFDAYDFLGQVALYADHLQAFVARGGTLCWGAVPTEPVDSLTPASLEARIRDGIGKMAVKGADPSLLARRLMVSPACGLGNRDPAIATRVFELLRGVSGMLR